MSSDRNRTPSKQMRKGGKQISFIVWWFSLGRIFNDPLTNVIFTRNDLISMRLHSSDLRYSTLVISRSSYGYNVPKKLSLIYARALKFSASTCMQINVDVDLFRITNLGVVRCLDTKWVVFIVDRSIKRNRWPAISNIWPRDYLSCIPIEKLSFCLSYVKHSEITGSDSMYSEQGFVSRQPAWKLLDGTTLHMAS